MATAQQLFVDQFVTLINNNPNLNARVIASSPHPGILRVTAKGTDSPWITWISAASSVTGTGTFASKAATGSPQYAELWFSWTLAPGDTVKLNVGAGISVDLTYNLPVGTTVDVGGFDHTGYTPGGSAGGVAVGGSGIGSAAHRRLVVMECGSASSSFGSMFALDPQDATGVAIPTFRVATSLPAAGSSQGESVYVTATRQGYVWDGTAWRDITASPIRSFANDAQLQANTTEAVGTYAVASDTGNMYVMTLDGWRRIGIVEFSTYADLIAYDAAIGTEAISRDMDVLFLRVEDGAGVESWIPISELVKTEAQILATGNVPGLAAIATDTGKRFVNNGTRWIQDPIEHYPTEADLLAATPIDGHLAWADDTSVVFTAAGGAWHRLQGPQISVGTVEPTGAATGDLWYLRSGDERGLKIWDGTDADPANHGWRDADRNPIMYVGAGAFNGGNVNRAGNWGMPAGTVPDPQNYMPQADDQYLDVNTGIYVRLTGPAPGGVGGALPASPVDSGITGGTTIGDVTPAGPLYTRISGDNYNTGDHFLSLPGGATQWVHMWGMVQHGGDFRAEPNVQFNNADWNLWSTTGNAHCQSMTQYEQDGIRDTANTYFTGHGAGFVYKGHQSYAVKGNHPLCVDLKATKFGSYWIFDLTSKYHSQNGTPMLMTASWQSSSNNAMTRIGVRVRGWNSNTAAAGPYSLNVSYL